MKQNKNSEVFRRKRKFLLVAPVGGGVLLTILFVALGGGKRGGDKTEDAAVKGINTHLPGVHVKDESKMDKFAAYKKAQQDSIVRAEKEKGAGGWMTKR